MSNLRFENFSCYSESGRLSQDDQEIIEILKNNKIKYVIVNKKDIMTRDCQFMRKYVAETFEPYLYFRDKQIMVYKLY